MRRASLKLLIDGGVGVEAEKALADLHLDVQSVRRIDPRMPDHMILQRAVKENRMIVTMDKDFGELVFHTKKTHAGVLLLRMESASGAMKAHALRTLFSNYARYMKRKF